MPGTMGGTFMGGEMMWWMTLMLLVPLLLVGLLALAFAWAVRADRATSQGAAADAPLTILQRRYARGDVGADEYERIRAAVTAD